MVNRSEKTYNSVMVVQRSDYKWGVTDLEGNIIVPVGKDDWIDGFDQGLARVKIGRVSINQVNNSNKWGIINEEGEEVLPVEYDEIWKFIGKNRYSTKVVKDGVKKDVYLHTLNPSLPIRGMDFHAIQHDDYDNYVTHYGEFSGSYAQDVMGYSDDVINDAFEGDPDAYWNID